MFDEPAAEFDGNISMPLSLTRMPLSSTRINAAEFNEKVLLNAAEFDENAADSEFDENTAELIFGENAAEFDEIECMPPSSLRPLYYSI